MEEKKIKSILLHNFEDKEALEVMRLLKANFPDKDSLAFAMTTENNKEMQVKDLLEHLEEEHKNMLAWQRSQAQAKAEKAE
ncbi:MAG: DUF3783 domain-containing protein [Spirochaetales bacterium]|nr:DUF3783 domain-containing protein [Spirochaetales bacterium]